MKIHLRFSQSSSVSCITAVMWLLLFQLTSVFFHLLLLRVLLLSLSCSSSLSPCLILPPFLPSFTPCPPDLFFFILFLPMLLFSLSSFSSFSSLLSFCCSSFFPTPSFFLSLLRLLLLPFLFLFFLPLPFFPPLLPPPPIRASVLQFVLFLSPSLPQFILRLY